MAAITITIGEKMIETKNREPKLKHGYDITSYLI